MNVNSNYNTALGICQMMLSQRSGGKRTFYSTEEIRGVANEVMAMQMFASLDLERLVAELETRFTVLTPSHKTLGSDDDHAAWLPSKNSSISWRHWDRYKLLITESLSGSAVEAIEEVLTDVLARLEDPDRKGEWDRRGLVMGSVQSGKTASYTGLICKAADAGYKVVIVLTGMHNSLRSQTQIRLDEGFLGFRSQPRTTPGMESFIPVGVGNLDSSIRANTGTNRTERGDFNKAVANQFGISPGGLPLLFVVKKNTKVLQNLISWIRSYADAYEADTNRRYVRNVPMLLIDDEADIGSVDTRKQEFDDQGQPDPDHDPTKTNKLIRRLLRSFEKVAYVGYTATPFANIFIHDAGATRELGADLFPRSFIVNLPPPSNYIGPAKVFGIPIDDDAGLEEVRPLPLVRPVSDHAFSEESDEEHGWMPPKLTAKTEHVPLYEGLRSVPPSLREALMAFVIAISVRKIRTPSPHFNSMLVHVVRYKDVQKIVAEEVETALDEIVQRLKFGDGEHKPTVRAEFLNLWENDVVPSHHGCREVLGESVAFAELPDWKLVDKALLDSATSIKIRIINGSAGDILDYEEHKATGLNVIAVGGDKLARGLTLEGLSVSYFLRASRMYDTLMQMGRWFGYRDGYIDVCRLYTSREIIEWFTHIASASEELRGEFDLMVNVGGTPRDYGLKVRSHPVLLVTSAAKMRNGTELSLSFAGDISETIIFSRDERWIAKNFAVTEDWITKLGDPDPNLDIKAEGPVGSQLWTGRTASEVLEFLNAYVSHRDAARANTTLLTRFIRRQNEENELLEWTVLLCSSRAEAARVEKFANLDIGLIKRAEFPEHDKQRKNRYSIRRLVSPSDEMKDLSEDELARAMRATVEFWEANTPEEDRTEGPPKAPGGTQIRSVRPATRGLLMLYPLDPEHAQIPKGTKPIIGLAISFPGSDNAVAITYVVTNVFINNGDDDDDL